MILLPLLLLLAQNSAALPGAIEGRVVGAGSDAPLARASIELRAEEERVPQVPGLPPQFLPPPLFSTTTDGEGRFLFPGVRPGRYRVVTVRQGFVRRSAAVTVTAGQRTELQVPMTATGAISGRVYGRNGEPIGNVTVQALTLSFRNGRRVTTPDQTVRTDDRGEYRLFWLAPGKYVVRATHPESDAAVAGPAEMAMSGRFSALGVSSSGGPGPGGAIFAVRSTGDPTLFDAFPPDADAQGDRYVPIYFPATLDNAAASALDVRAGGDLAGVDIQIAPVRLHHVRGAVVDGATGQMAQYASLRELREDTPFGPGLPGGLSNNGQSPIEADGSFDVTLLPGPHTLAGTAGSGTGYVTIVVGDGDLDGVRIPTAPSFDMQGRIRIDGPGDPADLANLRVSLLRNLPVSVAPSSYSVPRADSTFVLSATPGDYRINITPLLNLIAGPAFAMRVPPALTNAYVKSIQLGGVDVLNQGIRLESAPSQPLEIVIGTRPGSVEGSVAGAPPGTTVVLIPSVRHRFDLFHTTTVDPAGRFRLDQIPPGDYRLFAWQDVDEGAWQDPDFMRRYEELGTAVRVAEGTSVEAVLRLIRN